MFFGENRGFGTPLFLNGVIAGWVCTSIDGTFKHTLATHRVDDSGCFKSELQCKLALTKVFGE
jgi:hypothetical protein